MSTRYRNGERTGRSPNDKYIVDEETTSNDVNWGDVNVSTDLGTFERMRAQVIEFLSKQDALFVQDLACGAEPSEALPIRVITHNAWHSTFARNMFIRPSVEELASHMPEFTVFHAPHFEADDASLNSQCFVIVNYAAGEVIIGGTRYAGEIKKSIFSVMNLILPKKGILPMHCSANTNGENTAIFFGLQEQERPRFQQTRNVHSSAMMSTAGALTVSSTSKVVAMQNSSICPKRMSRRFSEPLDVEGLFSKMLFSMVKAYLISRMSVKRRTPVVRIRSNSSTIEPWIHGRSSTECDFLDLRCVWCSSTNLSITPEQAAYHFISGYTAKVAGTEVGVKEPQATFSACFGEPFMPMHPGVYADLLSAKMEQHGSTAWLINTGWNGGPYGVGKRMKIRYTRAMLNAALDGELDDVAYVKDERFGFEVPTSCPDVPSEVLQPRTTWDDKNAYDATADQLANMFNENFERYAAGVSDSVNQAAPKAV